VTKTSQKITHHRLEESLASLDNVSSTELIAVAILSMKWRQKQLQLT